MSTPKRAPLGSWHQRFVRPQQADDGGLMETIAYLLMHAVIILGGWADYRDGLKPWHRQG